MTDSVTRAIAAYRLRSSLALPTAALDDDQFATVLGACVGDRLLGVLGEAVAVGDLPVTEAQRDRLEDSLREWASHMVRVEQLALRVLAAFSQAGIRVRVLKGVALAHTSYEPAELRVFGDVDLLVAGNDLALAQAVLQRDFAGVRAQPELRPGFDRRFGKEVLVRCDGIEVDLHRVFIDGAFGLTIRTDDLFAPPYRFPLAGFELTALPMPQRLLHAAYAASIGDWPPRLVALRDVAQLILREAPNLLDVLMMAREWQCEIVLADAVVRSWDELGLTDESPLLVWAQRFEPDRRNRVLLAAHQGQARMFSRHLAALLVLPAWGQRWSYLRAIAVPSRAYLQARGFSARSHLLRPLRGFR